MTIEQQGDAAAAAFRDLHRLGDQPLGDLVALIEQTTGHDVAILDAPADQHGMAMRDPNRGMVFIGVARTRHPIRQRSTLAHELGHAHFDDWNIRRDLAKRDPEEIRADAFARHLLLPKTGLKSFLGDRRPVTESDLSAVVQHFLVSPQMVAIQLHQYGYIDASTKSQWMDLSAPRLAIRYGWRDQYDSLVEDSDRPRAPQRLLARAIEGYREGILSSQAIATLRGVSDEDVAEEFRQAGVARREYTAPALSADELPVVDVDLSALDRGDDGQDDDK